MQEKENSDSVLKTTDVQQIDDNGKAPLTDANKGMKELARMEMTREVAINLNYIGIISLVAYGLFFGQLYTWATGNKTIPLKFDLLFLLAIVMVFVLHELVHGLTISAFGGKPKYGFGMAAKVMPYFYATSEGVFSRNHFIIIAFAPFIGLTVVGVLLMFLVKPAAYYIMVALILNASGAIGDLWMAFNLFRFPKHVMVEDRKSDNIVYGRDDDKKVKIDANGIMSYFTRSFVITVAILVFLSIVISIVLYASGVSSFTIGPKNSIFNIYQFDGRNGFMLNFPIITLLSMSGVVASIYSFHESAKINK